MPGRASAKRYAQAAFDLALQRGQQDQWYEHLVLINQTLENPEFMAFLEHAKIPLRSKVQALEEVFQSVDPLVRNMLSLLVSRGSVGLVPEVEQRYQRLLNEHMGREQVEVRSAVPLEDAERDRVCPVFDPLDKQGGRARQSGRPRHFGWPG